MLSFKATPTQQDNTIPVDLGVREDIPLDSKLTFVVQTKKVFPHTQTIEVATIDGAVHTSLSLQANNLVLQDEHTAVATLDPLKTLDQSAFGKLQMRPVGEDGTPGDWTPLGILVRTPQITAIHCTSMDAPTCGIEGNNLFFVQAFSAAQDFSKATDVPTGFAENTFNVPTLADGTTLYLRLRDDPNTVSAIRLPTPVQKSATAQNSSTANTASSASAPPAASSLKTAQPSTNASTPLK